MSARHLFAFSIKLLPLHGHVLQLDVRREVAAHGTDVAVEVVAYVHNGQDCDCSRHLWQARQLELYGQAGRHVLCSGVFVALVFVAVRVVTGHGVVAYAHV